VCTIHRPKSGATERKAAYERHLASSVTEEAGFRTHQALVRSGHTRGSSSIASAASMNLGIGGGA
jgi:hypothetical protein